MPCLFHSSLNSYPSLQVLDFASCGDVHSVLTLKIGSSINSGVVHNADKSHNLKHNHILSNVNDFDDVNHTSVPSSPLLKDNAEPSASHIPLLPNVTINNGDFFLTKLFLHNYTTGMAASPFMAELHLLQRNLTLHGVTVFGLTVDEYRQILIRHILVGDCMHGIEDKDRTACQHFRRGFSTANDMAASAFSTLLSATAAQRTTDDLLLVVKALNIKYAFRSRNLRRQIIDKLKEQAQILMSDTKCADFMKFEQYDRPTLLSIASSHNISVASLTTTKNELKTAILEHFAHGNCCQSWADERHNPQNTSVPACKENVDSLLGAHINSHTHSQSMRNSLVVKWLISQQKKLAPTAMR